MCKGSNICPSFVNSNFWILKDSLGMKGAIAALDCSLDKEVYKDNVQWDTFRNKMYANISQAAVRGLENSVGAY
jgi:hypothetical protein